MAFDELAESHCDHDYTSASLPAKLFEHRAIMITPPPLCLRNFLSTAEPGGTRHRGGLPNGQPRMHGHQIDQTIAFLKATAEGRILPSAVAPVHPGSPDDGLVWTQRGMAGRPRPRRAEPTTAGRVPEPTQNPRRAQVKLCPLPLWRDWSSVPTRPHRPENASRRPRCRRQRFAAET